MPQSTLSDLQIRILDALRSAGVDWTLTGGAALAGYHLGHRRTDDLDLFLHGAKSVDEAPELIEGRLREAGFEVAALTRSPTFVRWSVSAQNDRVVVDLVAEPVPTIESPVMLRGVGVDTPHEILVNKLCALVSRSEPRDLEDVRALLEAGGDLRRALKDAPRKDGGFSPMTLAWLLGQLDLQRATELGFDAERLERFRGDLRSQLIGGSSL